MPDAYVKHLFVLVETNSDQVKEISSQDICRDLLDAEAKQELEFINFGNVDSDRMHVPVNNSVIDGLIKPRSA